MSGHTAAAAPQGTHAHTQLQKYRSRHCEEWGRCGADGAVCVMVAAVLCNHTSVCGCPSPRAVRRSALQSGRLARQGTPLHRQQQGLQCVMLSASRWYLVFASSHCCSRRSWYTLSYDVHVWCRCRTHTSRAGLAFPALCCSLLLCYRLIPHAQSNYVNCTSITCCHLLPALSLALHCHPDCLPACINTILCNVTDMPELMGINPAMFNNMDPAQLAQLQKMAAQVSL